MSYKPYMIYSSPPQASAKDINDRQFPQHLVIYRGFVEDEDYPSLEPELKSLQAVLTVAAKATVEDYAPETTYIAVAKQDPEIPGTNAKGRIEKDLARWV